MHWIVQENICQEQKWRELIDTLERLSLPYSIHKVVPFSGELIPEPELPTDNVFCFGSTSLHRYTKQKNWRPGTIELPNFAVQMRSKWNTEYLNRDCMIMTIDRLYREISGPKFNYPEYFIRPIDDSKFIAGQVMSTEEIKEWCKRIIVLKENDGSNVNSQSGIVISTPKKICKEARFWIVDDNIATYSMYKIGRTISYSKSMVDTKMIEYVWKLISIMSFIYWSPGSAYCLDIAEIDDQQYKIVEINGINSSGFYDCDINKLVIAIEGKFNVRI